jgi:hypothetical protein
MSASVNPVAIAPYSSLIEKFDADEKSTNRTKSRETRAHLDRLAERAALFLEIAQYVGHDA